MRPSRRGLLVAFAGSIGALLPVLVDARAWGVWPLYLGGMALAYGVDLALAPRRRQVAWEVAAPPCLYIGRAERAEVSIRVATRRPAALELLCDVSDELEPGPRLGGTVAAAGNRFELPLVARRRGTARIESLWLRCAGPLGLLERTFVFPVAREIPVLPDIQAVRSAALRFSLDREFRSGLRVERFRGEGTEFDSLREFVPGDDRRAIDWKGSARHTRMLCRQYRAERNRQVVLALDTGLLMAEPLGGIPKLDHALNAALLLAYVCLRNGDRTGFCTFDARFGAFLEPQSGMRALDAIHLATSRVAYSADETNFTLGLLTLQQRVRRRSLVVVLTDFADPLTAELMVENLHRLARRHFVLFVALRDPALDAIADAAPADARLLHRAVVAQGFVRERERVLRRLARAGIRAIDVEPRRVGPRLIDSYLEIKRRELV